MIVRKNGAAPKNGTEKLQVRLKVKTLRERIEFNDSEKELLDQGSTNWKLSASFSAKLLHYCAVILPKNLHAIDDALSISKKGIMEEM